MLYVEMLLGGLHENVKANRCREAVLSNIRGVLYFDPGFCSSLSGDYLYVCAAGDMEKIREIYADDVKCAHGSTVGQLSDAALFYMRQRGISEKEARMLLQVAFIREVIDQIELVPLRDRLHYLVDKRFRGELNKCEGCKLCR